jgi:hypothetical protein
MGKHYVVTWKDDNWVNWESMIFNDHEEAHARITKLYALHYDQIRLYWADPSMVYKHVPERNFAG